MSISRQRHQDKEDETELRQCGLGVCKKGWQGSLLTGNLAKITEHCIQLATIW